MKKTKIAKASTIPSIKTINKVSYSFAAKKVGGLASESTEKNSSKLIRKVSTDIVIIEQPLQITLSWSEQGIVKTKVFTITMRTPGQDKLLIIGLLHSEGVIKKLANIVSVKLASTEVSGEGWQNEWLVEFIDGFIPDLSSLDRYMMSYSSCGLCGTTSLKTLQLKTAVNLSYTEHKNTIVAESLLSLSNEMRSGQGLFDETGGVHGAALFTQLVTQKVNPNSEQVLAQMFNLQQLYEDIGRHNAVDKVIGALLISDTNNKLEFDNNGESSQEVPLRLLLVSGRISFEIVQKAIMAGIHVLVAVGAPSELAIQAAKQFDLTLIGFVSAKGFNVYHGDWRLAN